MIQKARIQSDDDGFHVSTAPQDVTAAELARTDFVEEAGEEDAEAEEAMRSAEQTVKAIPSSSALSSAVDKELHSFEIDPSQVRVLRCMQKCTIDLAAVVEESSRLYVGQATPKRCAKLSR